MAENPASRPAGNVRTDRAVKTLKRLRDAAVRAFSEYGYAGTRVADIAKIAGISHGNFYRYFRHKDEALSEVLRPILQELMDVTRRPPPPEGGRSVAEDLVIISRSYLTAYARHRRLLRTMIEAASVNPTFARLWLDFRSRIIARTTRWLQHLHEQGRIEWANFPVLADALGSMLEQIAYIHVGLRQELIRHEEIDELGRIAGEIWVRSIPGLAESSSLGVGAAVSRGEPRGPVDASEQR